MEYERVTIRKVENGYILYVGSVQFIFYDLEHVIGNLKENGWV